MRMRLRIVRTGIVWRDVELGMVRFEADLAIAAVAAGAALLTEVV
jgi:hypothetical protein